MSSTALRIGGVPFGVGAPLLAGLDTETGVDFVRAPPRRLIALLRQGDLDAALVSSIEAFRHPGYVVAPELAICSAGPVRSVRAFLRVPAARVRTAAVDSGSATSVALLRVLLERRHGARIERQWDVPPDVQPDGVDADAVLLIGDAGLKASAGRRAVLDLGADWFEWQHLPFVFALWLLRGGTDIERLVPCLRAARAEALRRGVDDGTGGAVYYRLGPDERRGLEAFRSQAAALDLCNPDVAPRFLG